MKHIYHNIDGWFSFADFYTSIVKRMPDGARLVEIGTYKGCSFSYLIVEAINSGKKFDIVGVDACPWPDVEVDFNKNMEPLNGHFRTLFGGDSFDRIKEFEDQSIDFAFVDANHTYEYVKKDIQALLPKMKPNGIIAGHDFNQAHEGVIQAVIESFIGDVNVNRQGFYQKPKNIDGKPGKTLQYIKSQDVWVVEL